MTGKQMCETIAWVRFARTGEALDPSAIWNASPTGELWHVFGLFDEACIWIAEKYENVRLTREVDTTPGPTYGNWTWRREPLPS
jgi:hypothetical protein